MPREFEDLLQDILDSIDKIFSYTAGMTHESFARDDRTFDAVLRNFTIIGEVASVLAENPALSGMNIPWNEIKAMHNIIVHEYFAVADEIVWKTIQNDLRPFRDQIAKIRQGLTP
jgi:uncharacterized protein with HEPN domain